MRINLSPGVWDYFKGFAEETGLPYQKLIDLLSSRLREEPKETGREVGDVEKKRDPSRLAQRVGRAPSTQGRRSRTTTTAAAMPATTNKSPGTLVSEGSS